MPCFDEVETENIENCVNSEVQAGLSEVGLYYALHLNLLAYPMPKKIGDVGYDYASAVNVSTAITFTAGKGWGKIAFQPETGEGTVELVGAKGNKKAKQVLTFTIPGNSPQALGYFMTMKNVPSLYLYTERDGQKRIVGDKNNPAYITDAKATTGKGGEDDKVIVVTIESWGVPVVYTSTLQLPA